jgi:hypothetical protein
MKNSTNNNVVTAIAKTIKGTAFIGLKGYENKQGEVSNQTIIGGITYENVLVHDFNQLKEKQQKAFDTLIKDYTNELILIAYTNLYNSLEKRLSSDEVKEALRQQNDQTIKLSDAQKDAYIHLAKGVKLNKETNQLHIFGLVVRKQIVKAIEYKETNSKELTIVQNKIKKICEFKQDKYRSFIFDNGQVNLQGVSL